MPRLALLCGMICSGKSTYAQQLKKQWNAVVLSWDRLTLAFFPEQLGEEHDRILEATDDYLLEMAEQTGFTILRQEDQTLLWREYYLEAIWNDSFCCEEYKLLQKEYKGKKLRYTMSVGRKE